MLGLLYRLIIGYFGCFHNWKTIKSVPLDGDYGGRGARYILECGKCGHIKKVDLI